MKTTTVFDDIEVVELSNEDAAEVISEFSGLELLPIEPDATREKLIRAGFVQRSERSLFRAEVVL